MIAHPRTQRCPRREAGRRRSRHTTHADPIYVTHGVVHHCVANMPGAVPKASTRALNNVTLPYALAMAGPGYKEALFNNPRFRDGLNAWSGKIARKSVAEAQGLEWLPPEQALAG